ncbi:HTH-like domain-containing protein [Burkholderia sp. b13]|nr:HTH-like domain-containing protein [Burkholderia sp. b13]
MLGLRQQYPLEGLLKLAGLVRSTFYYQQKALSTADKYAELKTKILTLFEQHKGRYGYRLITLALRNLEQVINHKTVQRLMQRQFHAQRPNEKWATDVTEFNVGGHKLDLSPVLDLYNGEIAADETSRRAAFEMVSTSFEIPRPITVATQFIRIPCLIGLTPLATRLDGLCRCGSGGWSPLH